MKKFLAKLMAFIFVINMVPIVMFTQTAHAATIDFNAYFDRNWMTTNGDDNPKYNIVPALVPKNIVTVDYKLLPADTAGNGVTLHYPVDENTVVRFNYRDDVATPITKYQARFEVYKFIGGAWVLSDFTPEVFSSANGSSFTNALTYSQSKPPGSSHELLDTLTGLQGTAGSLLPPLPATLSYYFRADKGNGFSFKFDGFEVSFKHDKHNNTMNFTTNKVYGGKVYDFVLTSDAVGNTPNPIKVYSGLDINRVDFIPVANENPPVTITNPTPGGGYDVINNVAMDQTHPIRNNNYILEYDEATNVLPAGKRSAAPPATNYKNPELGIAVRFDEPIFYNLNTFTGVMPATAVPTAPLSHTDYKLSFKLQMDHNLTAISKRVELVIPNIFTLPAAGGALGSGQTVSAMGGTLNATGPLDISANNTPVRFLTTNGTYGAKRAEVLITNLLPGMLFDNVDVESTLVRDGATENILNNIDGHPIDFGKVFTFLEYSFAFDGMDFRVEFKPYQGYKGYYNVIINKSSLPLKNPFYSDGLAPISHRLASLIPADYTIEFLPDELSTGNASDWDKAMYSETSKFDALKSPLIIGVARDFKVDEARLRALPFYENDAQFGTKGLLDLKLSWNIGHLFAIEKEITRAGYLDVEYDLLKSYTDTAADALPYGHIKMKITATGSGFYQADYKIYSIADKADYVTAIPIATGSSQLVIKDTFYRITVEMKDIPAERSMTVDLNKEELKFYYEKVYFMGLETLPRMGAPKISLFDSMTLSDIVDLEVPPVRDLKEEVALKEQNKFGISWGISAEQLFEYYYRYSYYPLDDIFRYNILISQDEEAIKAMANMPFHQIENSTEKYTYIDTPGGSDFNYNFTEDQKQQLRADKVVLLKGVQKNILVESQEFEDAMKNKTDFRKTMEFTNVDTNETYYIYVILEISHKYLDSTSAIQYKTKQSKVSNLIGISSKDDPNPPIDDKRPPGVEVKIKDVTLDKATVYWQKSEHPKENSNEKIYYEIIRTKGKMFDSKYLNFYDPIVDFYKVLTNELPNTEITIFRTPLNGAGNSVEKFNGSNFSAVPTDEIEVVFTEEEVSINDKSLSSNSIYFYSVRTVKVTDSGKTIFSIWNYESCTTSTIPAPINLKIVTDANYDPKTEIVINFDAPLNKLDALGKEFALEYSIREDNGDFGDPIRLDSNTLKNDSKKSEDEGYFNFTHKITNLKPDTLYFIKVRMVSLTSKDFSMWSNTESAKTNQDKDAVIKDKDTQAWLDFYKEQLQFLLQKDYWTTQNSSNRHEIVYRPTMFDNVVAKSNTGAIVAPIGLVDTGTLTYYIPASSLLTANTNGKGFSVDINNINIITAPHTINLDLNQEVKTILEKINKDNIKDYYAVITVEIKPYTNKINGQSPLSPEVVVSLSLQGSSETSITWDNERLLEYGKQIDLELKKDSVRDKIANMVKNKNSNEAISKYVMGLVETFDKNMISKNSSSFKKVQKGGSNKLTTFDAPITIALKNVDVSTSVQGYMLQPSLSTIETIQFSSGRALYARNTGSYIFTGIIISIEGMPNQPNIGTTYAIVSKYGLTDFLGADGKINTTSNASRSIVLNSTARMMGAPKGSDPVQYLKAKGYNVSGAGLENVATTQETIYLVMAVYETKTNTKVSTIKITNHNLLANVSGINEQYKPSIKAAYQLNLYTVTPLVPKNPVTIKDLLDLLTNLDTRSNL